ncbi:MAG: hypothetical protein NT138_27595 [Planctomycetales bacterium]|jgi:hypothetical protein|nr:hypothetical protein [Planctomycetales bacterium]
MQILRYLWALPATLLGLPLVFTAKLTGGRVRMRDGVIAVSGGASARLLYPSWFHQGGAAMTFGHVIIARDEKCLYQSWNHERHHVRQFEQWGLLLIPAYWLVGFVLWFRGYDPYLDNPFEPPPE